MEMWIYLSPETLLSYSIETLIGEREIGLIIVDEAHIVTTWGVGFRPDYWYLGGYINRIRNGVQVRTSAAQKIQHFPICAFTATAINGGKDDSISETIVSLYMENPIKYIGYAKRENIGFDIKIREQKKLSNSKYEERKAECFSQRIEQYLKNKEKTIVYFPYAAYARDAHKGVQIFGKTKYSNERIGLYTGGNTEGKKVEDFKLEKEKAFHQFRSGEKNIMFATKAFGMGVDIDDIQNVYHYAASGNLSDYVQEIGRAARKKEMHGTAMTDYFYNDLTFMQRLFGMSQIRQYQVNQVLAGIYNVYKSKKCHRNFLITPETFTYIFNGKSGNQTDSAINKLKTCLLMLEKDLYDIYTFKVLISRPQSVFTKSFVVVEREHEKAVLTSRYGKYFTLVARGRVNETQPDGTLLTDIGDVYRLDLKSIWESENPNISFPQFKYWYFNSNSTAPDKIEIMPSIQKYIRPRQKVTIETKNELLLCELKEKLLDEFSYIADTLYDAFGRKYFQLESVTDLLKERYGRVKARMITNSLFDLVDPERKCVKYRVAASSGQREYCLSNGTLKDKMFQTVRHSSLMKKFAYIQEPCFSQYMNLTTNKPKTEQRGRCEATENADSVILKLLSVFDYITYEVLGGEEPEIFIRLNDPEKIRRIVSQEIKYSNSYVHRAKEKHERDVKVLSKFFVDLQTDEQRWDYIEDYFLGKDVLGEEQEEIGIEATPISEEQKDSKATPTIIYFDKKPLSWEKVYSALNEDVTAQECEWLKILCDFCKKNHVIQPWATVEIDVTNMSENNTIWPDLTWPEQMIALFSNKNSDGQEELKQNGWRVFSMNNASITPESLVNLLQKEK